MLRRVQFVQQVEAPARAGVLVQAALPLPEEAEQVARPEVVLAQGVERPLRAALRANFQYHFLVRLAYRPWPKALQTHLQK